MCTCNRTDALLLMFQFPLKSALQIGCATHFLLTLTHLGAIHSFTPSLNYSLPRPLICTCTLFNVAFSHPGTHTHTNTHINKHKMCGYNMGSPIGETQLPCCDCLTISCGVQRRQLRAIEMELLVYM